MKQYLLLFRGGNPSSAQSPDEMQSHMQKWALWMGSLSENGSLLGAQPLELSGRQVSGGGEVVTDGAYMEGKEIVGGYLMCQAVDYNEAVEISKGCPILEFTDGRVEIREVREMAM
jgi:hypothetical protein